MSNAAESIPFLITMDTEGDNLWENCGEVTTENSRYLPRFQSLCEVYGMRPTWLTAFEMASCPVYVDFARDCLRRDVCEVGTHLHAWDSPPLYDLTGDDRRHKPYLTEYPADVLAQKLGTLTQKLKDVFNVVPVSHRAGRWSINPRVVQLLLEQAYQVDCSVTPGVSWQHAVGNPKGAGGADFRRCPREPYWMSETDIAQPGSSDLLQIPVSIYSTAAGLVEIGKGVLVKAMSAVRPRFRHRRIRTTRHHWLRPNLTNAESMLRLLRLAKNQGWSCVEFMLHSSELMPGGSPNFTSETSIDQLYANIEQTFAEAANLGFRGMTLSEFRNSYRKGKGST